MLMYCDLWHKEFKIELQTGLLLETLLYRKNFGQAKNSAPHRVSMLEDSTQYVTLVTALAQDVGKGMVAAAIEAKLDRSNQCTYFINGQLEF